MFVCPDNNLTRKLDENLLVSETSCIFLVTVMLYLTYCDLAVNVLCKLINIMVSDTVLQYSHRCECCNFYSTANFRKDSGKYNSQIDAESNSERIYWSFATAVPLEHF